MRRAGRPIAALLILVLLQLVLVESGYACGTASATSRDAMADMAMPGTGHSPTAPAHPEQQSPCRFPWAPNGCQSMAPCAPVAVSVATAALAPSRVARAALPAFSPLAPPAFSRAPELPPPRA